MRVKPLRGQQMTRRSDFRVTREYRCRRLLSSRACRAVSKPAQSAIVFIAMGTQEHTPELCRLLDELQDERERACHQPGRFKFIARTRRPTKAE